MFHTVTLEQWGQLLLLQTQPKAIVSLLLQPLQASGGKFSSHTKERKITGLLLQPFTADYK